jgi:hypothetical protein
MGVMRTHRVLVAKPSGRTPLARPSCKWEDDFEMDLEKNENTQPSVQ